MVENQETPQTPPSHNSTPESSTETIEDTKQQLAEAYLNFLDKQKGGILATTAWLGVNLNPLQKEALEYLTTETTTKDKKDIFETIRKNIKKKSIEQISGWTILAYDKTSLSKMKALIMQNKNDQAKLQELMAQIQAGTDPTIETKNENTLNTTTAVAGWWVATVTGVEALPDSDKRKQVIEIVNKILKKDKDHPIHYTWWWRDSIYKGLDCSWLIIYAFHQAKFIAPWWDDSREMFTSLPTEKLIIKDKSESIEPISWVKEGDVLFRNTTNAQYDRKNNKIPTIEKNGHEYRIHHMAFVRSIDYVKGEITIVESNGAEWVTERTINAKEVLEKTDHKSELYVGKVNYDNLLAYTPPVGTTTTNELA